MLRLKRLTSDEYVDCQPGLKDRLEAPYEAVRMVLGDPHVWSDEDYPDDDFKTDVCWGVEDEDTGQRVCLWNYKNGPRYNKQVPTLSGIESFSVYYSDKEFYEKLKTEIEKYSLV